VGTTRQFCSFYVDGLCFGIEVTRIQEIREVTAMTRVPLAPREVGGLVNLRGHIITAIDLRRCLDLGDRPAGERPLNVILRAADGQVSLLVDRMGDVLDVSEDGFELPPRTLNARSRELIRGAYKLDGRLLLVLNLEAIVNGTRGGPAEGPGAGRPPESGRRLVGQGHL